MYKILLCWRYLRTRYLAMACIVSVMLGVATLIVVNSVMSGFSSKLRDRLHSFLSDIVLESAGIEGFAQPQEKMARIRAQPGLQEKIEAMTATLEVFGMLQYHWADQLVTRPVHLIGIDIDSRAAVGGFAKHLVNPLKQAQPSFELPPQMRQRYEERERWEQTLRAPPAESLDPNEPPPPAPTPFNIKIPQGAIVGQLIASFRNPHPTDEKDKDIFLLYPGDRVIITTVSGQRLAPVYDSFVVVDYFKSEMSEYDANYVFVPLNYLQHLRTMEDRVTSIQIKLKDYRDAAAVVDSLQELFPSGGLKVKTWEEKQGALLQAIRIERGILNVLLFLIIAVAGFGILAIFSMIVAEKTRDIGILKALGASNGGVMKIFLGYGLLLGLVGAGLGTVLGLTLTIHINDVEKGLSWLTGQEIFDRKVYYFNEIPTDIQAWSVILVNLGAVAIAVVFSVLPALKAALLQPVRALRYE